MSLTYQLVNIEDCGEAKNVYIYVVYESHNKLFKTSVPSTADEYALVQSAWSTLEQPIQQWVSSIDQGTNLIGQYFTPQPDGSLTFHNSPNNGNINVT